MTNHSRPAEITIDHFNVDQHDMAMIAAAHLAIRLKQREDRENWTQIQLDITNSQTDLLAIPEYYDKPSGKFFVATDHSVNAYAGFVGIKRLGLQAGELKRLAVIPEYRGLQLGLRLAQSAINWSFESGITTLSLVTGQKERARELVYEPLGFIITSTDEELGDFHMLLDLS